MIMGDFVGKTRVLETPFLGLNKLPPFEIESLDGCFQKYGYPKMDGL